MNTDKLRTVIIRLIEYETKAIAEVNRRGTTVRETLKAHFLPTLHYLVFTGYGVICALAVLSKAGMTYTNN